MDDLKSVCWVTLDQADLHHLRREYSISSARRTLANSTATADEHIVAKVYLGAAGQNGVSVDDAPRLGAFGAIGLIVMFYLALVGGFHTIGAVLERLT